MAGSMGAVAANMIFLIIFVRQAIHVGIRRHGLMEGGVESNDLRHSWKHFLAGLNAKQVSRIMQWSEIAAIFNLLHHVVIHDGAAAEEVCPLHYPVAYGINVIKRIKDAVLFIHQRTKNYAHSFFMIRDRKILHDFVFTCRSMLDPACRKPYFLNDSLRHKAVDIVALHVQKLILDG